MPPIWEPFTPGFSGQLVSFISASGHKYVFKKPYSVVTKGTHYMLCLDTEARSVRMLPVLVPEWMWRTR